MVIFSTKDSAYTAASAKPETAVNDGETVSTADGEAASTGSVKIAESESSNTASKIAVGETASQTEENQNTDNARGVSILMKNAYPEVNKLISDYFNARVEVDKGKIEKLVDNVSYAGIEELTQIMKNVENIKLTDCYTIDGPEDKAMMVYARNEIKFKGIDTAASSLDGFYVRTDETGDLKIVLSPLPDEVQKIIDSDVNRDDVSALLSDVNTKFAHEIKSDKKLANFFEKLQNRQAGSKEDIETSDDKDKNN